MHTFKKAEEEANSLLSGSRLQAVDYPQPQKTKRASIYSTGLVSKCKERTHIPSCDQPS